MTTKEVAENTWLFDIETFKSEFLFGAKKINQEVWKWFEVSAYKNEIDFMVKWLKEEKISYLAGFNNIMFDMQVLQYILDSHDKWYDKSSKNIINLIYQFAQDVIKGQDYDIKPPYKETFFDIAQIDLGRIHNFFNENKRTSLKWIEYMTDQVVDEMPFDHTEEYITEEQCNMVKEYCANDIRATETLWLYTVGDCDNILYKGKDKIQERLDAIDEFKLPKIAISYSDVKIGETVNLLGYMEEAGIDNYSKLYELKKQRKWKEFTFGECVPKYVKFTHPELVEIRQRVDKVKVNVMKDQKFEFTHKGLEYIIAKGGIHSVNKPVILESDDESELIEFDLSSQYPVSIIRRELYPQHLGKPWLKNYKKLTNKRTDAKKLGKTDVRQKGIAETLKISINGGGFGKLNETTSLQYDPFPAFSCTIGNQFEILMLIEWIVDTGCEILSANTDGALVRVPKKLKEKFLKVCKKWEDAAGITELGMGELEFTYYSKYIMLTVNDYIAIKTNGELKQKGDFVTDFLLEKNKNKRIIPIALVNYFVHNIPIEKTVTEHDAIYDFMIAKKASRDYSYEGVSKKGINSYKKLIRYYCSKGHDRGEKMFKIKNHDSDKTGTDRSVCEKTSNEQVLFNIPFSVENFSEYKIDYKWYIDRVKEIIAKIEPMKKLEYKQQESGQLSLF